MAWDWGSIPEDMTLEELVRVLNRRFKGLERHLSTSEDPPPGNVTVTPAPASARASAPDPTVIAGGNLTVIPAAASARARAVSPTVVAPQQAPANITVEADFVQP